MKNEFRCGHGGGPATRTGGLRLKQPADRPMNHPSGGPLRQPIPLMKILVVDDDRVARKVLRAFLEEAHYEIVAAEDGRQAIDILLGADAPPIVILDWVMPGMSGPEVCAKLRAAQLKTRPYVLMLSAKTDKAEVVAGLDAGADDFLSKPFNLAELLARLRVARRMVEYETDLNRKIAEFDSLQQRHQLLGELIAAPAQTGQPPAQPHSPIAREQLAKIATVALAQLGLGEVGATEPPGGDQPPRVSYAAWTALVAIDEQLWIDLVLEGTPQVLGSLIEKTLHRRGKSDLPRHAFLAEALTIVGSALRTELRQRDCDSLMPYLSRGLYLERPRLRLPVPEHAVPIHLDLAGHPLQLTAVEHPAPVRRKPSHQLHLLEVLAEAYPPPRVHEVPLLNRGAVLNAHCIEKLTAFAEATSEQHPIPVYVPTPLATFFHHEGAG